MSPDDTFSAVLARLDIMQGEIRELVRVMDRHVAADEAWTALGARVVGVLTESAAGRVLVAVVVVRIMFGSTADTLLLAGIQQAFGVAP